MPVILPMNCIREYIPTQKFGEIYPLIYPVIVCPNCWYAALPRHFSELPPDILVIVAEYTDKRKKLISPVFPNIDFVHDRTLKEGVASYMLAATCYEDYPLDSMPSFLRGLCFLRAGWLARYLHKKQPNEHYDYLAAILLRKAAYFYGETVRNHENGKEKIDDIMHFGPDMDINYGFDGIYYLASILQFRYGQIENKINRLKMLKFARITVSRLVGMGHSSRAKPTPFLEMGRELYGKIKSELKELESAS